MRKICVVTGTRAEYGLLYWLMKEIQNNSNLNLQIVVTGMHLSPEFGYTFNEIEKDGFKIDKKIEMLLSADSPISISKSMGLAQISFSEAFDDLSPDILVLLGDRYETFSAASSAMISNIPIAHIHGGETTEGAIDESMRHAITKMSHIHFTAMKSYSDRVIQLGENPMNVFNVGGLGIENIIKLKLLNKNEFENSISFKLAKKNILVTFHPVTLELNSSATQFQELLDAIDTLKDTNIIFTKCNSDANGRVINHMIDIYVSKRNNSISFTSLGQLRYLSALKHVDMVIGNSSSGIAEVPSFKIPTINIGDRQKGRIKAASIIDCKPEKNEIINAFNRANHKNFHKILKNVINPYGDGIASKKIVKVLNSVELKNILKKKFYNLNQS